MDAYVMQLWGQAETSAMPAFLFKTFGMPLTGQHGNGHGAIRVNDTLTRQVTEARNTATVCHNKQSFWSAQVASQAIRQQGQCGSA